MNIDELYRTVQSQPHGSSGRGVSYWAEANRCGRRANLAVLHSTPPVESDEDINPLRVGTFYHALQEQMMQPSLDHVWDMTDSAVQDVDWMEALRLFRTYVRDWVSPVTKWSASVVSVEEKLPKSEAVKVLVKDLFGDDVTFRADWVGDIFTQQDVDRVYANTGVLLPEPGRYIFDHKSAGARKEMHNWEYAFGNQSAAYIYLYNLEHPTTPAKGMIFDQIVRHKDISKEPLLNKTGSVKRESSYQAFLALPNEDAEKLIRNLVMRGKLNIETDTANSEECFSGYRPCWFFQNGLCRRF